MKIIPLNKGALISNDVNTDFMQQFDDKASCVFKTFENIELVVLDSLSELQDIIKYAILGSKMNKKFYVYAERTRDISLKDIEYLESSPSYYTQKFLLLLRKLTNKSFFLYALYVNKGLRSYVFNHKELINGLVYSVVKVIYKIAKKSYIALTAKDAETLITYTIVYILYCHFGIDSFGQLMDILKKLDISLFDRLRYSLAFKYIEKTSSNQNLIQILAHEFKWSKISTDTLYINLIKTFGPSLGTLLLQCKRHELQDPQLSIAYLLANIYSLYNFNILNQETNLQILNKLTDLELLKSFRIIQKIAQKSHFGNC